MTIVGERYRSKPFEVDAVHVTEENFDECARWCGSTISEENGARFIRVRVNKPMKPRQTKAFVGDWIFYSDIQGYKVYNDSAFTMMFEKIETGVASGS